ncbi:hypothetical protein D3C78_1756910 [compost metagenome]
MSATKINGAEIRGGSITSNTTIDVTTDLKIGNNILFIDDIDKTTPQTIVFPGRGSITFRTNGMEISGFQDLSLVAGRVTINSGVGSQEVATKPWVLANAGSGGGYAKFK